MTPEWSGVDPIDMPVHPAADQFPMLPGDELDALAEDIKANGLVEPLWLWDDGDTRWLLDGRNRLAACAKAGVAPTTRMYDGDDPVSFVVSQNVHRRHLSVGQRAAIAWALTPMYEEQTKRGRPEKVADRQPLNGSKYERLAATRAGEAVGVSGRAVARFDRIEREAPDLVEKVKTDEMSLDAAEKQLKRRKRQEADRAARQATPPPKADTPRSVSGDGWTIYHGDFTDILAADAWTHTIDGIVTDPPYPTEFLPLISQLGGIARRVLRPQAICAVLFGQMNVHEVYRRLDEHLDYAWTYAELIPQSSNRMVGRHITSNWKPWVAYSNGAWPSGRIDWHTDVVQGPKPGDDYIWQQDQTAAAHLIQHLTPDDGVVLDPFLGMGSYGVAALHTGRRFIGVELDTDRFEHAVEALRNV